MKVLGAILAKFKKKTNVNFHFSSKRINFERKCERKEAACSNWLGARSGAGNVKAELG